MALYLDGDRVGAGASVTSAQSIIGYWRIGYNSLAYRTFQPTSDYFAGNIANAEAFTSTAFTATQVKQQYAAGS